MFNLHSQNDMAINDLEVKEVSDLLTNKVSKNYFKNYFIINFNVNQRCAEENQNDPKKIVTSFLNEVTNCVSNHLAIMVTIISFSFTKTITLTNVIQNFNELNLIFLKIDLLVYLNDQKEVTSFILKTLSFDYVKVVNFIKVSITNQV